MPSKPRHPRRWICRHCGVTVTVYVDLKDIPVHLCSKRMGKMYGMELDTPPEEEA